MEPLSASTWVFIGLIQIFATTTKMCTRDFVLVAGCVVGGGGFLDLLRVQFVLGLYLEVLLS